MVILTLKNLTDYYAAQIEEWEFQHEGQTLDLDPRQLASAYSRDLDASWDRILTDPWSPGEKP